MVVIMVVIMVVMKKILFQLQNIQDPLAKTILEEAWSTTKVNQHKMIGTTSAVRAKVNLKNVATKAWNLSFAECAEIAPEIKKKSGTDMFTLRDKTTKKQICVELPLGVLTWDLRPSMKKDNTSVLDSKAFTYMALDEEDCTKLGTSVENVHAKLAAFENDALAYIRNTETLCPSKWKTKFEQMTVHHLVKESDKGYKPSLGLNFYLDKSSTTLEDALIAVQATQNSVLYNHIKGLHRGATIRALIVPSYIWSGPLGVGVTWIVREILIKSNEPLVKCIAWAGEDETQQQEIFVATSAMPIPGLTAEEEDQSAPPSLEFFPDEQQQPMAKRQKRF